MSPVLGNIVPELLGALILLSEIIHDLVETAYFFVVLPYLGPHGLDSLFDRCGVHPARCAYRHLLQPPHLSQAPHLPKNTCRVRSRRLV